MKWLLTLSTLTILAALWAGAAALLTMTVVQPVVRESQELRRSLDRLEETLHRLERLSSVPLP